MYRTFKDHIDCFSEIFFLKDHSFSMILFILTLLSPLVAISATISLLSIVLFSKVIRIGRSYLENKFYVYNPVLSGISVGFFFNITLRSILMIIIASIFTLLITIAFSILFSKFSLPVLSLPFTIVSIIMYIAASKYSLTFSNTLNIFTHFNIDPIFNQFFISLGMVFFLPYTFVGITLSLLLLMYSRIIFLLSVLGFYSGIAIHSLFINSFEKALYHNCNFNYILISIALGGFFLIPSIRSIIISIMAISVSIIFIDIMDINVFSSHIPLFTLPFNFVVLIILFVLKKLKFKELNCNFNKTPEKSLEEHLILSKRFSKNKISIFPPFTGKWTIYQENDDIWTHKGIWKHAYDFIITDTHKKSYKNNGDHLEDYYSFKKPVLSPITGYITSVVSHLKDNAISEVDNINNWGNYVIIRSLDGIFVEISHFAQNSITVIPGTYVEAGQFIGSCGNSGYSPEPHIHVQVQQNNLLGSATLPFSFVTYKTKNTIKWYNSPKKNEIIEAYWLDNIINNIMSFTLDKKYIYEIYTDNNKTDTLIFTVCMDEFSGKFYFKDQFNNKLFFNKNTSMFYFYDYIGQDNSILQMIYTAIPRMPLILKPKTQWNDFVPTYFLNNKLSKHIISLLSIYNNSLFFARGQWKVTSDNIIEGSYSNYAKDHIKIELDPLNGFKNIIFKNKHIRKVT